VLIQNSNAIILVTGTDFAPWSNDTINLGTSSERWKVLYGVTLVTTNPVGATYGGTGLATQASSGIPSINGGTWAVNNVLTAGRVLYGAASNAVASSANLFFDGTNLGIGATPLFPLHVGGRFVHGGDISSVGNDGWGIQTSGGSIYVDAHGTSTIFRVGAGAGENAAEREVMRFTGSTGVIKFNGAYSFPTTDGTNDQVLTTNGFGTATWTTKTGAGDGGINTLEGQTGATQTFGDDTNVTIVSSGDNHQLTWAGQLGVARGGTNIASYAVGDLLYASGATTLSKLADVAVGQVLCSGGVGTAPAWSATPHLTGSLAIGSAVAKGLLDIYNDAVTVAAGEAVGIRRTMTHDGRTVGVPEATHFVADFIEMKTYSTRNMQWCGNWITTIGSTATENYFGVGQEIDVQNDRGLADIGAGVLNTPEFPHDHNTNQGLSVVNGNGAYDNFSAFNILSNYNPAAVASHGFLYGLWVGACVKTAGIYFDYQVNQGHALTPDYLILAKSGAATTTFSVTGAGTLLATRYTGDIVPLVDSTGSVGTDDGAGGNRWAYVWADNVYGKTMNTGDLVFANGWRITEDGSELILLNEAGEVATNLSRLESRLAALERRA